VNICEKTAALWIIEPVGDTVCRFPVQWQPPVTKNLITCPKCGTAQVNTSTGVKCRVIFDKIAIHSRRQPPDNLSSFQQCARFSNLTVKGFWNMIRHAIPGGILLLIALQPLIACFMVDRWSGKEIAWLNLSEAK
jgi:hypothetical protein